MPNSERIQQLLQFHQEDPKDPFVIYALALEYQNPNDPKALLYFAKFLQNISHYLTDKPTRRQSEKQQYLRKGHQSSKAKTGSTCTQ